MSTLRTACAVGDVVMSAITHAELRYGVACAGDPAREARNLDANALFVSRAPDPPSAAGGEFDDQMVWIPVGLLYGRMVAAGVLP